jgi:hypothetical protein
MGKRPGNSRWSEGLAPEVTNTPSEFEQVTACLRLQPNQYTDSAELRHWVEKNWRQKFVPESLLKAMRLSEWGLPEE